MKDYYWIQKAIQKPNALKNWLKKNYGKKAFTKKGKISIKFLRSLLAKHKKGRIKLSKKTIARIRLAITLKKLKK
jgi:hypothetical protein